MYKDITEYVYASANVVSEDKYNCRSTRSGIISQVFITKGDIIKKGQLLFKIKATADINNRLNNATVNLGEAKENLFGNNSKLNAIKIKLQSTREQNLIDSTNYMRRKSLWSKGIGSKSQLETTQLKYQATTNQLSELQLEYNQIEINLKNNLEKAQNQVSTERSLLNDLEVRSQIDGRVFTVKKELGELINPQETFAVIGSIDQYVIKMNIDEVDISKVNLGDTAIIDLEAYPNAVYSSTLSYISEIKDEMTQTFMVEATFVQSPQKLYDGLAGEANILIERRNNAIIIPSDYIVENNKVLTENGKKIIKIGVKNMEFVEVKDGIEMSTILLKPEEE